jgi:glycerol-3-phosphate dehydrogenase (NAD(P)+)
MRAKQENRAPVAVLGAGSWGTALAILLARHGPVTLWDHNALRAEAMERARRNAQYLPNVELPGALRVTAELAVALGSAELVLLVVPSSAFRGVLRQCLPHLRSTTRLAWATKGLDPGTGKLLSQVVADVVGPQMPTAVVSGPTFAGEVAARRPTAVSVASASTSFARDLARRLHDETFRPYTSTDIIGVELGGAAKNVIAIATGIADGLALGANTQAALITRGLAEIMRLGRALGGQRETFMGLAGLGDLVLTCTDNQSRNRRFGLALAKGMTTDEAIQSIGQVVEGFQAAREVRSVARAQQVEMPITEQVYAVLYAGRSPRDAEYALLQRVTKPEFA